jgi:nicotinamidase-related amidase
MSVPTPKTLLQMRNVAIPRATLSDASLVIIDAQADYQSGRLPLSGIDRSLASIAALLKRARGAGAPIFHVTQLGQAGSLFDGAGGAILPQAAPEQGEPIVTKRLPNAFAGTELHDLLQKAGRRNLVLAGFMTHMCISASARAGLDLGYHVNVVADATATRALPSHDGGASIPADIVHRTALAELADRFAAIVTSTELAA